MTPTQEPLCAADHPVRTAPGSELLVGAIDSHVHCAPHINRRSVSLFDAVAQASRAGLAGLGIMDVFANTSGLAALANGELGHLGVDVFGGVILEPYSGGLSLRIVETALKMGYREGDGARFISLPCHHTAFVARSENRSDTYIETCLSIPDSGPLPDPLSAIIDACIEADVVFNLGHLSGPEMVRVTQAAAAQGCTRMLCPAGYLDHDEATAIAGTGAHLEYSFFVFSHATQIGQTMIDAERHKFQLANFERAVSIIKAIGADRFVISSDSGALVLPTPVEAFRCFMSMFSSSGVSDADLQTMSATNPAHLFKVAQGEVARRGNGAS